VRALIVEDEEIVRELLESIAHREFEFEEVRGVSDGESAWEAFSSESFDFVVTDLLLPKLDGLSLARRMLEAVPGVRILALSSECDDYTVHEVSQSGILGFVNKNELSLESLFEAYSKVASGRVYHSSQFKEKLKEVGKDPHAYYKVLSEREFQVWRAFAMGKVKEDIAEELKISPFTVRRHKHNTMKKLGVKDEASLIRFALAKGIIKNKGGLDWTEANYCKL
jgi:DNA-binding NarL/FixJ family response regulator